MADLDWIMGICDRRTNKSFLHRAPSAVRRARPDVPGCRRDDLIVLDLACLDFDPMAERAANRLGRSPAASIPLGRLDIPRVIQAKLTQRVLGLSIELDPLVHPREVAQQHAGAAQLAEHVKDKRVMVLPGFTMMAASYDLARQRAGFEAAIVLVANRRRPRVFAFHVDYVLPRGNRRTIERMQPPGLIVPSVERVLSCMLLVHQLVGITLAVIDTAFHNQRRIAALDGRLVVFVLMRQITPTDVPTVAATVGVRTDVFAHAPIEAEVRVRVLAPLVNPRQEIIIGSDLFVALHRTAKPDG